MNHEPVVARRGSIELLDFDGRHGAHVATARRRSRVVGLRERRDVYIGAVLADQIVILTLDVRPLERGLELSLEGTNVFGASWRELQRFAGRFIQLPGPPPPLATGFTFRP